MELHDSFISAAIESTDKGQVVWILEGDKSRFSTYIGSTQVYLYYPTTVGPAREPFVYIRVSGDLSQTIATPECSTLLDAARRYADRRRARVITEMVSTLIGD